ncbi:adenylyl-sulfate kinase [Paenibacillus sp. NPDC058177]|uniref:adenylyl-sulfate kinase n=1 Tax=Paenibacillus sp. NPDC058177 TaxID=3346369 RepID=UPI0036DCCBE2
MKKSNEHTDNITKDTLFESSFSGKVFWFTGLSGAGKTTIALGIKEKLLNNNFRTVVIDGDTLRSGLNKDLAFTMKDRSESVRRAAEVAELFRQEGFIVLVTLISPLQRDRDRARYRIGGGFFEVYVKCPLQICEQRDPKGLYKRAREGEIKDFTGIDSVYEYPISPDLEIDTNDLSVRRAISEGYEFVKNELYRQ